MTIKEGFKNKPGLLMVVLLLLFLGHSGAYSVTLDDLESSGDFRISVMLEPKENIIVSQEVSLIIDIATAGWFARGTEFDLPELKNAIITQRERFATNSSFREGGKSWALQRWELSVFPMTEGTLTVPELSLLVNVSVPGKGIVEGSIMTPELSIQARMPPKMKGKDGWLATPELRINQSFDKPLDTLKIGDAFKQTIVFKGEKILAMMLPSYGAPTVDGLAVYPEQPQLTDINVRGSKQGERTEVFNYIVESEGEYQLPSKAFYIWNTETDTREEITIPSTRIMIGGEGGQAVLKQNEAGDDAPVSLFSLNTQLALFAAASVVLLLVIIFRKISFGETKKETLTLRLIEQEIAQASKVGDLKLLANWLYVWVDYSDFNGEKNLRSFVALFNSPQLAEQVETILQGAFSPLKPEHQMLMKVPRLTSNKMWQSIKKSIKPEPNITLEP